VTAGKLILSGNVVTMNAAFDVVAHGRVCVSGNRIAHVLKPADPLPDDFKGVAVTDTKGTIYPGLIELHNHLSYDMLTLWVVPKKYGAREEWQSDPDYKRRVSLPPNTLGQDPKLLPAMTRYVEAKCLFGGVTTSQGIGLSKAGSIKKYYEGAIRIVEVPRVPGLKGANTSVPDVAASTWSKFDAELKKASCMLLHLAEGTSDKARKHFLSLKNASGDWAVTNALAGIHCTALQGAADFDVLGKAGASVVWSPLSNFLLYGDTTKTNIARSSGCKVSLGSDWSPSGSKNLLFELKVAHITSGARNLGFSDRDLVAAATIVPAKILKWDALLGSIETGKLADLAVLSGTTGDPYTKLCRAKETDIVLVVIDGVPKYGRSTFMKALAPGAETVHVGHEIFMAAFDKDPDLPFVTLADATASLADALKHLPDLVNAKPKMLMARNPNAFTLDADEQEEAPFDLDPVQRNAAKMMMLAAPPLPPVAVDLDPVTLVDDAKFFDNLKAAANLPADIKSGIAALA
jgi:5-methylthioadenosine/S-adenosylhomocysteine deaminase